MLWLLLFGFATAAVAPVLQQRLGQRAGWLFAVFPLTVFIWLQTQTGAVSNGGVVMESYDLLPSLGIHLSFLLDGLSLLFGVLISGIGALVLIYAEGYLKGHPLQGRFFAFLLMFMSAMLGVVLANDLIALFVFWELTSLASYMLIGFNHESEKSRDAALQALLVTGVGGLALLAGFLMLGNVTGTFQIGGPLPVTGEPLPQYIRAQGEVIRGHSLYLPIFLLIALGAFTKSAQFPFHFWLPNAMAAPTPVSAYLHSATMVKAGVYLMARFDVAMGSTPAWTWTLGVAGLVTMVLGSVRALRETDLKRILAFSTITALGTLVLLIGLSFKDALKAAVVFLMVHSLYKGTLFMVAGSVDHEAGSREVPQLGGLRSAMPYTATAALIAACSMAGFPPLFGFIGKELAYKAKLGLDVAAAWWVPGLGVLANAFTVTAALVVALRPFWGKLRHPAGSHPHEAPPSMWVGPAVLAAYCLLLGIYPGHIDDRLIAPAVQAVVGKPVEIHLALWYGVNVALLLSVVTVAVGVGVYACWDRVQLLLARLDPLWSNGAERAYWLGLRGLLRFAELETSLLMRGGLRRYLQWILLVILLAPGITLFVKGGAALPTSWAPVFFAESVLAVVIISAAVAAASSPGRMTAIAAIGVVGFTVALLFEILSAPDLAITQLLVETLFVVIVVLIVHRLPKLAVTFPLGPAARIRNAVIAVGIGSLVTVLLWSVGGQPFSEHISGFFAANSLPRGHGQNVVNVVLVDFRATDTLGETVVLVVAALGVFALMKVRQGARKGTETPDSSLKKGAA